MLKRRLAGAVNGDFGGECPRVLADAQLMSPTLAPTFDSIEDNVGASVLRRPVGMYTDEACPLRPTVVVH